MQAHEIVKFWGSENLKKWSRHSLGHMNMPESSKEFLSEVGLPSKDVGWTIRFDHETDHPFRIEGKNECWCIGFDYRERICLDTRGRVVLVEREGMERFINSSVELFGECLTLFQQYRMSPVAQLDDDSEQVMQIISTIEHSMRKVDPSAFQNEDCYWATMVEQMRHGQL